MSVRWIFRQLRRGDKDRQPTQGEFFATDAIRSVAEALVRESIQNSLDASLRVSGEAVRVRFHLGTIPTKTIQNYFKEGWSHFTAAGNGLDDVPSLEDFWCSFLTVEDFATTGLIGDVNQWRHEQGVKNPFYYFFRTEGRSGKGEEDRGRWGIGKYVFPRSSQINAFFALTVRSDDNRRLLMGQAVLKSHIVGSNYFTPDGDYGLDGKDGFVLPAEDPKLLDRFSQDFALQRKNQTGLSVVVPWVDPQIDDEAILRAVIEDYFYPILSGLLVVSVSHGGSEVEISKTSLSGVCRKLGEEFEKRMLPLLELTNWSRENMAAAAIRLNPADNQRPKWEPQLVPNDKITELRGKFRSGQRLSIEIPLTVRERGQPARDSFFRVFLVKDGTEEGAPVFIRDGITISDVRGRWVPGVRSLVIVDHPPLAKLLGDSENPAHTQWQRDREHFRHKYPYGKSYIDFVSHSVSMFVRYLNESDEQPAKDLLREIFFVPKKPESAEPKEKSKPRKRNKGDVIEPNPSIERVKRRFTLAKVAGGFTITHGEKGAELPTVLEIAVAYDRRRGSPLKKYAAADFKLNEAPITVETEGAKSGERHLNRMVVKVTQPEFKVTVTGFDENRDLFVDVKAKEAEDDSQA